MPHGRSNRSQRVAPTEPSSSLARHRLARSQPPASSALSRCSSTPAGPARRCVDATERPRSPAASAHRRASNPPWRTGGGPRPLVADRAHLQGPPSTGRRLRAAQPDRRRCRAALGTAAASHLPCDPAAPRSPVTSRPARPHPPVRLPPDRRPSGEVPRRRHGIRSGLRPRRAGQTRRVRPGTRCRARSQPPRARPASRTPVARRPGRPGHQDSSRPRPLRRPARTPARAGRRRVLSRQRQPQRTPARGRR
jgi:hypothetical protein